MRRWGPVLLLLLLAVGLYYGLQSTTAPHPGAGTAATSPAPTPPKAVPPAPNAVPRPPPMPTLASSPSPQAGSTLTSNVSAASPAQVDPLPPELANIAPETALENMRTVIRQYGALFAGNPVGTNPEITEALQGQNPKHINFLKSDGNRINSRGELVDVWGTPYFFHQISGSEMERGQIG